MAASHEQKDHGFAFGAPAYEVVSGSGFRLVAARALFLRQHGRKRERPHSAKEFVRNSRRFRVVSNISLIVSSRIRRHSCCRGPGQFLQADGSPGFFRQYRNASSFSWLSGLR